MADCVSVLAVTLVGDEKRRLGERRISAMGRFLLPSLKAEWNCVGGSGGHPSPIPLGFARGFGKQGRFSRKARELAHPQLFRSMSKKQTRYTSPLKWPTRQGHLGYVIAELLRPVVQHGRIPNAQRHSANRPRTRLPCLRSATRGSPGVK